MIREVVTRLAAKPWWIAGGLLGLIALWILSGVLFPKPRVSTVPVAASASEPAPQVQIARVAAQPVARAVALSGRTAPARTVELKAETTGRVVAVGATRGARVARGALIARLDDADRVARLAQTRAVLKQRELEYEGQQQLKPQGYISDAKLAEAVALLETARAELRRAELDLARMEIRAPFDGALQDRNVEVGDYVSPGARIGTFVDERRLVVAASLAETQAAGVRRGLQGRARLATGEEVQGVVRYVAPVADPSTRTFNVELELANPRGSVPVGVTAQIELNVGTVMAHRVSPALLTLDDAGTVGIKILDAQGRATFVPANIARSSPEGVWLVGLPDPAQVITVGQGFVRAGQLVRAETLPPAPEALASSQPLPAPKRE
jgi:multidrug efflux system membrane fusion protein